MHDPPLSPGARRPAITLLAAAGAGACLLLAACAGGSTAGSGSASGAVHAVPAPGRAASAAGGQLASLTLSGQSIIYTATLAAQAIDVAAAADRAGEIVTAAGGFIASEQEVAMPGQRGSGKANLELKIPVDAYPATLSKLSASVGTVTSVSRQARDVTRQVADVASRVTSAQAAVAQLRALLRKAASVSSLLQVQGQINAQESALEELQAEQRALSRQTSYATVSLVLTAPPPARTHARPAQHGFVAGLAGGWRAFRLAVSGLLTGIGAVLPFAAIFAVAGALWYGGLRMRRGRSGAAPPGQRAPGPTAP